MARHLKALGLAFVALAAMSAVFAGSASAQFTSEQASTTTLRVTSNSQQEFRYQAGGIQVLCSFVSGNGTMTGTASTSASFPTILQGCKALGEAADVTSSCTWEFTTHTGGFSHGLHLCQGGGTLQFTVTAFGTSVCTLTIGSQTFLSGVTKNNTGGSGTSMEIELSTNLTGIAATRTGSALCGAATSTTGSYVGSTRIRGGQAGGTQVGITVS